MIDVHAVALTRRQERSALIWIRRIRRLVTEKSSVTITRSCGPYGAMVETQGRSLHRRWTCRSVVDVKVFDVAVCSHHVHVRETISVGGKLFETTNALRRE